MQTAIGERINRWGCYEMGSHLKLGLSNQKLEKNVSAGASVKKQKSIRSLFCQNKQSAAKYISNVEIGIFPSTKDVEQIPRWTKTQQNKLDQAKSDGTWQSNGWFSKEFDFMLPDSTLTTSVNESESEGVLSRIAGFGALGNLF